MLTRREKQIMEMVSMGYTIEEISKKLFISESTVTTHKQNIQRKLKAKNSCQCVAIYLKRMMNKKS